MAAVLDIKLEKIDIVFESGDLRAHILKAGEVSNLEKARLILKKKEIKIIIGLNNGKEKAIAWGCDLTEEYVRINACYN